VIIGNKFDSLICYSVSALDITNFESDLSEEDCIRSNSFAQKELVELNNNHGNVFKDDLLPPYPNPANPGTVITFSLSEKSFVIIKLYDLLGNEISTLVKGYKDSGRHSFDLNIGNINRYLASGVYVVNLKTNKSNISRKINFIK
jgi:hypothetical protein